MSATEGGELPGPGEQPPDGGGEPTPGDGLPESGPEEGSFIAAERAHRLAKLDRLRQRGIDPYPIRFDPDHTLAQLRERYGDLAPGEERDDVVRVAGRAMLIRRHGKLTFAQLHDRTGSAQLFVSRADVGDQAFDEFQELDLGDWVGAEGTVMTTRTGELSVRVRSFQLLAKSLRGLPSKGHGLADVDTRFRQRYLDLIVNPDDRRVFEVRSRAISSIRRTLADKGFTEVETPVLDTAAGGAAARPFTTHHNALDLDMYLRIALELPLKRLVVGGMERVFEIGRVFRNEGLDTRHNPEFTLLEAYAAYWDYTDVMDLVEELVATSARDALGTTEVQIDGRTVDLAPPWPRVPMAELVRRHAGVEMHPSMPVERAREIATRFGIAIESDWGSGRLMNEVYDATCEAKLVEPTFVIDHPREVSPLARTHRDDPLLVERFETVVAGRELANAYSELNDPVDQRARFEAEARAKAAGDEEAEDVDEDYIRALEYGLPPTGGLGIGIDRLVMLLTGAGSIREVILFPTMRPEEGSMRGRRAAHGLAAAGALPTPEDLGRDAPSAEAAVASGAELAEATASEPPRAETLHPHEPTARRLAWLTGLVGLGSLLPRLPVVSERFGLDPLLARPGRAATDVVTVVVALGLMLIAHQLAHQKRRAMEIAVLLFAIGTVAHLLSGPRLLVAGLDAGLALALLRWRHAFFARGDPRSPFAALRFVPAYLGGVLVFGFGALALEHRRLDPPLSFGGGLETILAGLAGYDGPYRFESSVFGRFFEATLLTLGIFGIAAVAFLLLRPLVARSGPSERDRARARELVHRYGEDTLAYFALRRDKSYFFSRDGRAMVAYAYASGYALVAGDPIGARGAIPALIDEFLGFCRERAWRVAFLSVREADADLYSARGLRNVYLGDEAIIHCDTFNLAGAARKSVRTAVKRVGRDNRFALLRESDASADLIARLNRISEEWRGKEPERGFTMDLGREVEGREPDFLLALCLDGDERPVGFLRLVPCYGRDPGYSLDLMRRLPDAPNGINEFLIANTALTLGAGGFRRLSMNFAAWGRLFGDGSQLSPWERAQRALASALNPFFQIRSLRDFNEKFGPEWLPRSVVIEDPGAAPKVALLFASVEGFVRLPLIGRYLVPPAPTGHGGD